MFIHKECTQFTVFQYNTYIHILATLIQLSKQIDVGRPATPPSSGQALDVDRSIDKYKLHGYRNQCCGSVIIRWSDDYLKHETASHHTTYQC